MEKKGHKTKDQKWDKKVKATKPYMVVYKPIDWKRKTTQQNREQKGGCSTKTEKRKEEKMNNPQSRYNELREHKVWW